MKIIKEGKTKEELEKVLNKTKRFECKTCGCIFEAGDDEYELQNNLAYSIYYCTCPNCERIAYEMRMR